MSKLNSRRYEYFQPNKLDKKDQYGDCVIRALCKVFNKEWLDMFDSIIPLCRELQCPYNVKDCYERYLLDNGFVYYGISNKKGSKRPTVDEFAKDHKEGTYYLNVANHCVAVVDGKYHDTWDCGYKALYGYYELVTS